MFQTYLFTNFKKSTSNYQTFVSASSKMELNHENYLQSIRGRQARKTSVKF